MKLYCAFNSKSGVESLMGQILNETDWHCYGSLRELFQNHPADVIVGIVEPMNIEMIDENLYICDKIRLVSLYSGSFQKCYFKNGKIARLIVS